MVSSLKTVVKGIPSLKVEKRLLFSVTRHEKHRRHIHSIHHIETPIHKHQESVNDGSRKKTMFRQSEATCSHPESIDRWLGSLSVESVCLWYHCSTGHNGKCDHRCIHCTKSRFCLQRLPGFFEQRLIDIRPACHSLLPAELSGLHEVWFLFTQQQHIILDSLFILFDRHTSLWQDINVRVPAHLWPQLSVLTFTSTLRPGLLPGKHCCRLLFGSIRTQTSPLGQYGVGIDGWTRMCLHLQHVVLHVVSLCAGIRSLC